MYIDIAMSAVTARTFRRSVRCGEIADVPMCCWLRAPTRCPVVEAHSTDQP
jgi:hypothetical protein